LVAAAHEPFHNCARHQFQAIYGVEYFGFEQIGELIQGSEFNA
jgi:hypothetical protein